MTKRERVKMLRKALGKTQQQFAQELGLGFSAVSHSERENGTAFYSRKVMEKMGELYHVNMDWIMTGRGEMFSQGMPQRMSAEPGAQLSGSIFPTLRRHGEKVMDYGNPNLNVLVVAVDTNNEEWVAVVPEYALASYSEGYRDANFIRELPMETVPEDLRGRGTIRKFQVYGDSMEPEFYHGDWVYCSYVETSSSRLMGLKIRDRHIYVIITQERGPLLKRIGYLDGDEFLQCYSINEAHKPFPLHLQEVRELWYVRRKYSGHFTAAPENTGKELAQLQKNIFETNKRVDQIGEGIEDLKKMIGGKGE